MHVRATMAQAITMSVRRRDEVVRGRVDASIAGAWSDDEASGMLLCAVSECPQDTQNRKELSGTLAPHWGQIREDIVILMGCRAE